jgi:protein SCO1/2
MNRRDLLINFANRRAPVQRPDLPYRVGRFSNGVLLTHENKQVKFYDDLIHGRQAVINFMYANCTGACPLITEKLVQVHKALKDRMGKDLFIYSLTLYPEQDDPAALKKFATMHGALLPGWTFLTGDPYDLETIRYRLFRENHIKFDLDKGFHAAQLRIINDATNHWAHVSPNASMETILQHISWLDPPKSIEEIREENKILQEKIDADIKLHGYRRTV